LGGGERYHMADDAGSGPPSRRRTPSEGRIVSVPESPWRRKRRVRLRVLAGTVADVVMVVMFSCLVVFAIWVLEEQQHPARRPGVFRLSPGSDGVPAPER
jgi:hypothetical protein